MFPCPALSLPFLFFWIDINCVTVAAMTMTFAGVLCCFVCVCVYVIGEGVCAQLCARVYVCVLLMLQLLFWILLLVSVLRRIGFHSVHVNLCLWLRMQVWLWLCMWMCFRVCV